MLRTLIVATMLPVAFAGEPAKNAATKVELLTTRHLAVSVTIDGHGPYRMIFDTGSPVILVNSKIAKECKLFDSKRPRPKSKSNNAWPGQAILGTVEVGGVKAENLPATVFDHPTIKAIESIVGPIDGIIGYPFFARFRTTVDYANKTISLEPNGYEPEDVMQAMMASLFRGNRSNDSHVIAPAGHWGLAVEKPHSDASPGVVVTKVFRESPAAKAGLHVGDRVLTIGSRWTDTVSDCYSAAAASRVGIPSTVSIARDGKQLEIQIIPIAGS